MQKLTFFKVDKETELLEYMYEQFSNQSRTSVKKMLQHRQFIIEGIPITQFDYPLEAGDEVFVMTQAQSKAVEHLVDIGILYEDRDLIVIHKASGVLSVPGQDPETDTALDQVTRYVKELNHRGRVFVVHRLDRDTSGVMMFAKNVETQEILQSNWHEMVNERIYRAVVIGKFPEGKSMIKSYLTEDQQFMVHSSRVDNGGKLAITHYEKISGNDKYSLVEAKLDTGRRNQIRVAMRDLGHPIVGDWKYGARANPIKRLGLHAYRISFEHPRTGETMSFTSPIPNDFKRIIK